MPIQGEASGDMAQVRVCIITAINQEVHLTTQAVALFNSPQVRDDRIPGSRWQRRIARAGLAIAVLSVAMPPAAVASEQRAQAPADLPNVQVQGFEIQRKNFRFGQFTGWLKRDGTWHIEGPVRHKGLLCGTYEVGMRFGVGERECTDVQWISGVSFVTSEYQCNDAERPHSGTEIDESLAGQFDGITCAERVIRCSGTCK